jgi:hypothetical protein
VDDFQPLGALDAFKNSSGSRPWGPDDRWRAVFGGGVVDDLVEGIRSHPDAVKRRFSAKAEAYPVVVGCVPWLNSPDVVDALLTLEGCCVVVDKSARGAQLDRLSTDALGVQQKVFRSLQYWGPRHDGQAPVISPGTAQDFEERLLEPVRVLGWRKRGKEQPVPLLHAKIAVCCAAYGWDGEFGGWDEHLMPLSVWMGSANWTTWSAKHLEFGAWSTDELLTKAAFEFVIDVIRASELRDSSAPLPTPQLVEGKWDDDAFAELAREMAEAHEDDEIG